MTGAGFRNRDPTIWVLLDDRAGNRSQCLGVAEALGLRFQIHDLEYVAAAALPNFFLGANYAGLTASSRINLVPPWPDLVIAAGRRTAPVARKIKADSGGQTKLVQLMYPGSAGTEDFDLIVAPRHDRLGPRPNLVEIIGAPHRVTAARLEAEAEAWRERFADLPSPRWALIVGGSTKRRAFTDDMARELGRMASRMTSETGGSLLITTSRRTGDAAGALLAEITVPSHVFRWGDTGENPYMGYLAVADGIIVTGDSASMVSEACATTGPVYVYAPRALTVQKHARLHAELYDKGYARPLDGTHEIWNHEPLNAAAEVAAEIRTRFGL